MGNDDLKALIASRLQHAASTRKRTAERKAAPEIWWFVCKGEFVEGELAPHFIEGYNVLRYKAGDVPPAQAIASAPSYNGLFVWYTGVSKAVSASGGTRRWKTLAEISAMSWDDQPAEPYPASPTTNGKE